MNFDEKYNELQGKARRVNCLGMIYNHVEQQMKWDAMKWHDKDEEHDEAWFTEPEEDDYNYDNYLAYKEVLTMIEKLAEK